MFVVDVPISPATSASRPEKTILHSPKPGSEGLHSRTTSSRTAFGMGEVCFHVTALEYDFPAERGDAPKAWILNHGWVERRTMNR